MIPQIFNIHKRNLLKERKKSSFHKHDFLHRDVFLNHLDCLDMHQMDFANITLIDVPDYFLDDPLAQAFIKKKNVQNIIKLTRQNEIFPYNIHNQDAIIALLTCHAINDLPGYLFQIRKALKSDGVFIASFIGDKISILLRSCLATAEIDLSNRHIHRFGPVIDIRNLGSLLQRAGFSLPVANTENFQVQYKNIVDIYHDIRGMGEANCLTNSQYPLTKTIWAKNLALLEENIPDHIFNIDIITITGRSPSEKQQKPLKPGSAQISLTKILNNDQK